MGQCASIWTERARKVPGFMSEARFEERRAIRPPSPGCRLNVAHRVSAGSGIPAHPPSLRRKPASAGLFQRASEMAFQPSGTSLASTLCERMSTPELTVLLQPSPPRRDKTWLRAARRAKLLSWASLGWMTAEGAVGVIAGIVAGSVALLGFGLDSAIEGLASVIVIWRFTGTRTHSETSERRAQRAVAISFLLLAPYIAVDAVVTLATGHHPET